MKNLKWVLIAVLLAGLTLSIAACGGEDAPASQPTEVLQAPTNTPIPEPTATPTPPPPTDTPPPPPTDTPPPEPTEALQPSEDTGVSGGFDMGALGQPENLDSFRSSMTVSWRGTSADGSDVSESMMIAVEFVREPLAQHVTISGNFPGMEEAGMEGDETLEMYVVDDMMYMNLFGSWIQAPADQSALDASEMAFVAADDMLRGLEDANYEGTTTYNDIEVEHYSFTETSFSTEDMPEGMELQEASGNIYIAQEGDYVVHMDMTMSGTNMELPTGEAAEALQSGTLEIIVDLFDINQPITIEVPEEALASGQPPDDIPVPDDAEQLQVVDFMGMITFFSPGSPEQVADFYKAEMPNNAWTEVTVDEMGDMYSMEYSKGDRTASILITTDSETGQTSVLITVEGGG